MIIMGFPGIGKSSLSNNKKCKVIDLESTNFWVDGKRDENWYKVYCNLAIDLSRQGFLVFTSSHGLVQNWFATMDEGIKDQIYICYPINSSEMKEYWLRKLMDRYEKSKSDKDMRAYENMAKNYEDNIKAMEHSPFHKIELGDPSYNLELIVNSLM